MQQEPSLPSSQPSVFERQRKPKREYKKRKHTKMFRLSNDHHHTSITPGTSVANILPIQPSLPSSIGSSLYSGDIDIMSGIYSSEEEMPTPVPLVCKLFVANNSNLIIYNLIIYKLIIVGIQYITFRLLL